MKLKYIAYSLNIIIGLTLGCLHVHCKHDRETREIGSYERHDENKAHKQATDIPVNTEYEYKFTIDDAKNSYETSNYQRVNWYHKEPYTLSPSQIKRLNGTYIWKSKIYFHTQREMFNYICEHFDEMQKYKVTSVPPKKVKAESRRYSNIYDEYNDRLDEYLDDPEDEIEFDPEIFDFQDD